MQYCFWAGRTSRVEGQSAVEMAIILPVLLILLVGIVSAGFMFYAYIQVSNATREGARAGSLFRMTQFDTGWTLEETVQKAIYDSDTGQSALGFLPLDASSFVVTSDVVSTLEDGNTSDTCALDTTAPCQGDRLYVEVTYRYTQPFLSTFMPVFPQPLVIVRNVMMEMQ
jgi:hypothetical protein